MTDEVQRDIEGGVASGAGDGRGGRHDRRSWRLWLPALLLQIALVVVVVVSVLELQAASSYLVSTGSISFQLRPAWPGGRLVMPLGPAGELSLHTHRTPVDVEMEYRLPEQTAALLEDDAADLPRLEGGARDAFARHLLGRLPWLLVAGAAAGLLVTGHPTRRRLLWGAAGGTAAALLLGGALALTSYATLDRSPEIQYSGLASRVPEMLPLLRALSEGGDHSDRLSRLEDYLDGLEAVAGQLTTESRRPARADVVRLLLASDVHDNVFGARTAAGLAAGDGEPVDAVLLAGDLTDRGTTEEAQLFLRAFGSRRMPVLFVGGNHEDSPAMRAFRRAGFTELTGSVVTVSGVRVLGASDPVADDVQVDSDEAKLAGAAVRLDALWRLAEPRPPVVLVHDRRQAASVIESAKESETPLVVAYGNDHVAGVKVDGAVVEVDAGTAGASGYEAIGKSLASPSPEAEPSAESRSAYTYQLIDFSRAEPERLVAVTTVSYAGGGRTVVTYTPFGE